MSRPAPARAGIVPALVDAPFHDRDYRESIEFGSALLLAITPALLIVALIAGIAIGSVIA